MVGFYKHDIPAWMDGTERLSDAAYRAYHVIVQLIMLNEGPITPNDRGIAGRCNQTVKTFTKALNELIAARKLTMKDGQIWNARAESELAFVQKNRENAGKGGKTRADREKARENSAADPSKSLENNNSPQAPLESLSSLKEETREEKNTPEANASVPKGTPRNRKPKGTLCPDDLRPNEAHYSHCEREGVPRAFADEMCRRMQSWSHENANREVAWKSDWLKALHNFIAREIDKRRSETATPRASPPRGRAPSSQDHFLRLSAENHHEMTGASDDEGPFDDSAGPLFGSGGQGYGGGGRSDLGFDARVRQLPPRRDPRSVGPH